ncbi:MAG: hypothetical protein HOM25_12020 [Rhodospirillaceae bacterium]|jgi:hypothetical protein|nr:hypothetical protein [Rhodospirillaceae bacterium]MBT5665646.1 hypothetical protein [Rhodospirillaceae bacterium]MBT5808970.1 hypothetical protein [Rhodospirillaceae bacterium]
MRAQKDLAQIREQCARELPKRIDDAFATYRRYIAEPPPGDPKLFSAYQAGAKAALAHIEALTKLARWAEPINNDVDDDRTDRVDSLLEAARDAVSGSIVEPDDKEEEDDS